MKKAAIFDLNGVLLRGETLSERFNREKGILPSTFLPVLDEVMAKARLPNAGSIFSYWKFYLERWGIKMTEQEFLDFWFMPEKEQAEMTALLGELKGKGVKLFVLSNNFTERSDYYEKTFPFLKNFDHVYYSWQTGFVKPDPRAFEHVLAQQNLKPEEVIFFDDSARNVAAALLLGIESYVFESPAQVREKIF